VVRGFARRLVRLGIRAIDADLQRAYPMNRLSPNTPPR
jgi:hypothetical protein